MYYGHLFLISSASVRSMPFRSFFVPILHEMFLYPVLLKRSLVFPILLFSLYFHCSFKKAFSLALLFSVTLHSVGYTFPFLPCLSFLIFPQLSIIPPQTTTLPSCISFSWGWFWSLSPVCYKPPSIIIQTLCLQDLIPWIYPLDISTCVIIRDLI